METINYSIYDYNKKDVYYKNIINLKCLSIEGATWNKYDMNFDNIMNGMLTLFILSTHEGWPNYLFQFIDAGDDENSAPIYNNN